ncbi:hypothetical protein [Streptomyces qinzhouensis]|uniref:Lipoprotein CseA n=1 Tax=Streptomyces qinzhouensis TaxID=2599401 RepID=A0A5B8JLD0_9ACTN|nr:hypothetical protein [Streptomyces qinzhouensis]QDY78333.1 hypothetical protein FQU76_19605 [Streptomyces qinzhouensis]
MAALAVFGVFAAGCSAGGTGLRDSGPAPGEAAKNPGGPASSPPGQIPGAGAKTPDAVALLRKDPKVDPELKADLKPCAEGQYPVDVSLGHLTGGSVPDVVVNVTTCADAVAIGSFVYRLNGSAYQNVFMVTEPAVYSSIDRDELVVTKQVYEKTDPVATPTAEEVSTYRWTAGSPGRFVRTHWSRTQYSGMPGSAGETFVVPNNPYVPPPRTEEQGGRGAGPVGAGPAEPGAGSASGAVNPAATVPTAPVTAAARTPGRNREKS